MSNIDMQNKLRSLFQKIVEPNYVMDNYYGDSIINKLSSHDDPDIILLKKLPLLPDLLLKSLTEINNTHISVEVFVIRVFSIILKDELHFVKIYSRKDTTLHFEDAFSKINLPNMKPSLKVAYMELALALVKHATGVNWLLESGAWKNIFSLCSNKQTVFVVRQTYKFAGEFLWALNDLDDENSIKLVLNVILHPIMVNNYLNIQTLSDTDEAEHSKELEPMMHFLLSLFNKNEKIHKPSILMNNILNSYNVCNHLHIIIDRILRKKDTFNLACRLMFWLVIAKCLSNKSFIEGEMCDSLDIMDVVVIYFNLIALSINRRCATSVLDFCNACNMIWAQVWGKIKPTFKNSQGQHLLIQNQLVFIQLVPILVYIKKKDKNYCSPVATDESLNDYVLKLLSNSCEHTSRAAYAMRDLMMELDPLEITLQSVKRLSCLTNQLNNLQANIIFQALFYVLHDFDPSDDVGDIKPEEHYEASLERVQVMSYVMDTILLLLKNYDINWQQSIEVICLYSIVFSVLKRPNLSSKFVVTALNVIAVSIKQFLPPNLSLLLETKPGSPIHDLGKLLYTKMHDISWEVRDSALELLLVCTDISFTKFPPFQNQILENNLINMAATIAVHDHESYVQASALKCLASATKINVLWEQMRAEHPDILDKLITILRHNQEGIVRLEVVNVFNEIYQNIKLASESKHCLYEHMVSTTLTDFHWEVQIAALKFWKVVMQSVFTEQGMLDGTFPPQTFSKETRKIVSLNPAEIQRRIVKALDELASIGCLTVLAKQLQDDVDAEIIETALAIAEDLMVIIEKHKVVDVLNVSDKQDIVDVLCEVMETQDNSCPEAIVEETTSQPDAVIEEILNSDDINLLSNLYSQSMTLQNENPTEKIVTPKIKLVKYVNPVTFVYFLRSKDFQAVIDKKRAWNEGIRNLSSLLDDVLGIYEVSEDVNTMDCY